MRRSGSFSTLENKLPATHFNTLFNSMELKFFYWRIYYIKSSEARNIGLTTWIQQSITTHDLGRSLSNYVFILISNVPQHEKPKQVYGFWIKDNKIILLRKYVAWYIILHQRQHIGLKRFLSTVIRSLYVIFLFNMLCIAIGYDHKIP